MRVGHALRAGLLVAAMVAGVFGGTGQAWAAAASPADTVSAIAAALADKKPAVAEALARAALATSGNEASAGAANLHRLLGDALFDQGRFDAAEPEYRAALALREAVLGAETADTAVSVNDLAIVLKRLGRPAEAEPYYRRVLEIRDKVLGPTDPATTRSAYFYARIIDSNGRFADGAAAMAVAIDKARVVYGPTDPRTIQWRAERAAMLRSGGDAASAEREFLAVIAVAEGALAAGAPELAYARHWLGYLYAQNGRFAEAVPYFRAALTAREVTLGADDLDTIDTATQLAQALWQVDEIAEAETLYRRVLAARERLDGLDSAAVADALRWLGRAADRQDRKAEAEIVYKRALAISDRRSGGADVLTGFDLIALGQLYSGQQRFDEARPLLERAVAIFDASPDTRSAAAAGRMALSFLATATGQRETAIAVATQALADMVAIAGPQSREAADIMQSLGSMQEDAGRLDEAERLVMGAREIYAKVAPDGRSMVRTTSELGRIRAAQGRLDEALALEQAALATLSVRYGADSAEVETALAEVGRVLFAKGEYAGAAVHFEQAAAIVERLAAVDAASVFTARTGEVEDQAVAHAGVFDALIKTYDRLGRATPERSADYAAKAFVLAQRVVESDAAVALAQMAARQAAGDGELAVLVRERQDLVGDWRRADAALTAALGAPDGDASEVATLRTMLAKLDARLVVIDAALAEGFPDFAGLQQPALLDFEKLRARLAENEVLLVFADTGTTLGAGSETYLWAVPKRGNVRWVRLDRSSAELSAGVRAFREQMGVGAQTRGPKAIATANGKDRVGKVLTAALELDRALLGEVVDLIAGHDLVIVPSKSLSALPFHALVSRLPDNASQDRFRDARWLARDHAITILPSVASLQATTMPVAFTVVQGRSPYLAFANPLLLGRNGDDLSAVQRVGCVPSGPATIETAEAELPETGSLFRDANVDVAAVRDLPPLPETTDEVCAIATALGVTNDALFLGSNATEARVRALSADGELARANVLHFATHGLVSGDLAGLAEPAIVLTPPAKGSADDDGLLTASEVATLKLDADWVILSACNTAAGEAGGQALSGLARAFFYAGARALMVSHWPVNSEAAVALASGAVEELAANPSLGKAEALRRAMVAEIDRGGVHADPSSWAPFIVVGASR